MGASSAFSSDMKETVATIDSTVRGDVALAETASPLTQIVAMSDVNFKKVEIVKDPSITELYVPVIPVDNNMGNDHIMKLFKKIKLLPASAMEKGINNKASATRALTLNREVYSVGIHDQFAGDDFKKFGESHPEMFISRTFWGPTVIAPQMMLDAEEKSGWYFGYSRVAGGYSIGLSSAIQLRQDQFAQGS